MQIEQLADLEVFTQIVDSGRLAEAARVLDITKNAVTRSLARLEGQLAKQLILRTTRGVSLTEDGRRFYQHCQRILNEVALAEAALLDGESLRGTFRIGVPTLILRHEASLKKLGSLLQEHPGLELQVVASDRPFSMLEQRLDVAIAVGPVPDSELLQRRVTTIGNIRLAAAPSYVERRGRPKTMWELKHHQCLLFQGTTPEREWSLVDSEGTCHQVPVGGRFSCNDSRLLNSAMRAGLGIGIVSDTDLRESIKNKQLVTILPRVRFTPFLISLLYQKQAAKSRRLDPLLDVLANVVKSAVE